MLYRPEIDVLRALAIISVILYHAGFAIFNGGFVGVDVFFVISGYLITTILIQEFKEKQFSIVSFYERRARRILPALLIVLLINYLVACFLFLPGNLKIVGQYSVSAILSATNILLYLKGNDYFGLESGSNPLFHTWSLGVEEQYYLIIPILMTIFWSSKKYLQFTLFNCAAFISFAFIVYNSDDESFNFYMIVSRAWELAAGSIVAVVMVYKTLLTGNAFYASLGVFLIITSILFLKNTSDALHLQLIAPVIGSSLVIIFANKNNFIGRVLRIRLIVFIGLISYSLYLWHVPLLVYYRYVIGKDDPTLIPYFFILFIVSIASYRLVEQPFRNRELVSV